MRWFAVLVAAFLMGAPLATAQISTWKADAAHSAIEFTIRHLRLATVHGRLGDVDAVVHYDAEDVSKSTVSATIGLKTVNTGDTGRDDEIRSADFFDVRRFPKAVFSSTGISSNGDGGLWVRGNLTLHGITRPVVLNVRGPDKPVMGPDGKPHSGFLATTTIDRTLFDIGSGFPAAIVGDKVELTIDLDIVKE